MAQVEIGLLIYCVEYFDQQQNDRVHEENLDLLDEHRDEAEAQVILNKRRTEHYFN